MKKYLHSNVKAAFFTFLCLIAISTGFQSYTHILLRPIQVEAQAHESTNNYIYHSIAHPLVLALGLKRSDLTTKEGIKWEDSVGESLAQQIDPSVKYLGKNYESALLTYYFKLWIYHPQEMFDIYKNKFLNYKTFKISHSIRWDRITTFNAPFLGLIVLFIYLVNTSWKAWIILFSSFILLFMLRKKLSTVGLFLSLSIVGSCFLLLLESVIILHTFSITHLSVVNLLFFMIVFCYIQMIISYLQKNRSFFTLKIKKTHHKPHVEMS